MPEIKIIQEVHKCIGCTICETIAPQTWKMIENKAHLKEVELSENTEKIVKNIDESEISMHEMAAKSCPVECIHVKKSLSTIKVSVNHG